MRKLIILAAVFLLCTNAQAQWTDVNLVNPVGYVPFALDGQPVSSVDANVLTMTCNANQSVCGTAGINVQNFAEAGPVNAQFASLSTHLNAASSGIAALNAQVSSINTHLAGPVNAQFASLSTRLNAASSGITALNAHVSSIDTRLAGLDSQISQMLAAFSVDIKQANELAVVAAAMKDAIPNNGDRYAFRMNMAARDGNAAGSVSFSANVSNSLRLSVDYGRGQNQSMLSGGLNFSFN